MELCSQIRLLLAVTAWQTQNLERLSYFRRSVSNYFIFPTHRLEQQAREYFILCFSMSGLFFWKHNRRR